MAASLTACAAENEEKRTTRRIANGWPQIVGEEKRKTADFAKNRQMPGHISPMYSSG